MKEFIIAKKSALSSGEILKKYFKHISYKLKGKANPVTIADLKSQENIIKTIKKTFPTHSFFAEEKPQKFNNIENLWIIDPLDGTVNYTHNYPHFAISIAYLNKGEVKLAIVYNPVKEEFFHALKNKGAYLNDKRIKVSKTLKLKDSLLATGFPYDRDKKAEFYCSFYSSFIKISHDIRRAGSAALDLAWTASGRIDGYWEFNLSPWDISAGKLLVEEAGGKITDFKDKFLKKDLNSIYTWGKEILASNSLIHNEMLKIIKNKYNKKITYSNKFISH